MAADALRKGADLIAFGIPGTELLSPTLFRDYALPYAKDLTAMARDSGRWSLLHMCGHVKKLLPLIRDVRPTVLETLAPPPEGDILDIAAARDEVGRDIVAKGNMNLTFLANASPQEVYSEGRRIIERAGPRRFMLGVADVLLDYHPMENVRALVRAGHDVLRIPQ